MNKKGDIKPIIVVVVLLAACAIYPVTAIKIGRLEVADLNLTDDWGTSRLLINLSNPTTNMLGGVRAISCQGTDKVTGISTLGNPICGPDLTGLASTVTGVNTVIGSILLRGSAMINITGNLTDISFSFNNQSLDNLDIRQRADNNSVARTDRTNFIMGGLNTTTFMNTTQVWASRLNGSIDCKYITGGSDSNFCDDETGGSSSSLPVVINRTTKDFSTSSNTVLTNTSLSFGLAAHKNYTLICELMYTSAAATTGLATQLSSSVPAQNASISYETWSSATAKVGFSSTTFNTALVGTGSGASVIYTSILTGGFQAGTSNHNITVSIRSEISNSMVVVKRGSSCQLYSYE